MTAYVFDHTALLALGAGHGGLSRLVDMAYNDPRRRLYAPALCLAAATADRPALTDHIGMLDIIEVEQLDYSAAAAVGRVIAAGADWRSAHAVHIGRPTLDWLRGRPVVTADPASYEKWGVATVAIER